LKLLHDDALDYHKEEPRDWSDWKVVSNLPYSVASPILVELAQAQRAGIDCRNSATSGETVDGSSRRRIMAS
jgi:16S rRNA A1518/A1519 N6-dimethyltransferase RsmA/KsgA/DIM1 with predicted DNA glycosylase/AP lyase activity